MANSYESQEGAGLCCEFTRHHGEIRGDFFRARITDATGKCTDIREARNEAILRARIEGVYPGIEYVLSEQSSV